MSDKIYSSINEKMLNEQITIRGIALDAKSSAVIRLANGEIIYLKEKAFWEDELLNSEVIIKGILTEQKMIPDPQVTQNGAVSTGAYGTQLVLEKIVVIEKK